MDADDDGFDSARGIGSGTTEAEKEFEKVLEQLREAEGMKYYSDVYTKLYDSYFKLKEENGHQNEQISTLKTKLGRFDDTVSDYITELTDAQKKIERLMTEIEEARCLADAMHARELASVESLDTMKKTLVKLEKELDARKRAGEDDAGATSAVKEKERFEKEKARLQGELDGIKLRLNNALSYIEDLEHRNTAGEESIAKLEEKLESLMSNMSSCTLIFQEPTNSTGCQCVTSQTSMFWPCTDTMNQLFPIDDGIFDEDPEITQE